ncbi:MAG: hypothetical protein K0V04_24860, partial [Deltaproteobacteria bacterium]|nr:hypothetical protein [Deltaproteobacteria bacterium]
LAPTGGTRDMFIASYTSTGAHRWSQRHGGPGALLAAADLAVNDAGDVVVVGRLDGSVDVGGGLLTDAGATDIFAMGLDSSGAYQWSRAMGGTGGDRALGVAVDGGGGAVVVGSFSGTVDLGTGSLVSQGSSDGFTLRLSATGVSQWANRFGGTSIDGGNDVVLDGSGNCYLVGGFSGAVDLGDGPLTTSGGFDVFVASYDASGTLRWSQGGGSSGLDYGRGITLDTAGNPVAAGGFSSASADFGSGTLTGAGAYDTWIASYASATGAPMDSANIGTSAVERGYDVAATPGGTFVVVGTFTDTLPVAGTTLVSAGGFTDLFVTSLAL